MPIRKSKRHLYPPKAEWLKIREAILERAGHACECRGECGHDHDGGSHADDGDDRDARKPGRCRAPDRKTVHRYEYDQTPSARTCPWADTWDEEPDGITALDLEACGVIVRGRALVLVVLTIAHLDHDPTHNDPSNLRAFCQRCHLRYDREHHAKTRRETRAAKSGQGRMT